MRGPIRVLVQKQDSPSENGDLGPVNENERTISEREKIAHVGRAPEEECSHTTAGELSMMISAYDVVHNTVAHTFPLRKGRSAMALSLPIYL
jgi:hypothetical protein